MPHCSRDLELTGTASSFISLGQDAELGGVESQLFGRGARKAATPVCVHGGRVVRRRWKAQGGSAREGQALPPRCISGPVPGTSSRLGHKRDPQLPAVAFTERTFVKRVSFNFACKKIILHIFCTSLTVPIEPGPCGFAEGRGHDFLRPQPHPRGEGGIGKRRRQPGNREPGGRAGGRAVALQLRPEAQPTPVCRGHRAQPSSPVAASPQRGEEWHCLSARKGQPVLDKTRWC